MKVHILGAGAMGCLWAAHLRFSSPSANVSFIDSRITDQQAPNSSLNFSVESPFLGHIPDHEAQSFERLTPFTTDLIECVFVCTKSFDALTGLNSLKDKISENTVIVLFQNGLGSQYDIVESFPANPIFAAVTTEGANKQSSAHIVHAGKGITRVGPLTQTAKNEIVYQGLLEHLQTNQGLETIDVQYEPNIWQALWHKLVINSAINPYTALLNCPNGEVSESSRFKGEWPELRKELAELLEHAEHPISEEAIEALVFDVMNKTQANISSMLQDVRAGKRTEIADINGFAARFLASHNLSNTMNKTLEEDIKSITGEQ